MEKKTFVKKYSPQEAVVALQGDQKGALAAARYVRTKFDLTEQKFVLEKLTQDTPHVKFYLTGICFASAWNEVWMRSNTASISSAQKSLDWFALVIKRHALKLQSHISLRNRLSQASLQGDWTEARNIIDEHHKTFGPTLWALNWSIVAIEETYGAKKKNAFIGEFEQEKNGQVVVVLARLFGFSSDQALPDEFFTKIITNHLPTSGARRHFLELLFFDTCSTNWSVSGILEVLDYTTIIDRYELFLRMVCNGLSEFHPDALRLKRAIFVAGGLGGRHADTG